jgi:HEPN domain-containing protein
MRDDRASSEAEAWFLHGERDLHSARLLLKNDGPSDTIAFLLQQTTEKYIKGYLITRGWKLRKIHDLEALLRDAIEFDIAFEEFLDFGRLLSAAYIESRYPVGPPEEYSQKQISDWLSDTEKLISLIKH